MKAIVTSPSIVLIISALFACPALASTIRVPADQPTIQAGIVAASGGDLVLVAPDTYLENIDFLGKAITVQGEAGPDVTEIDGNQAGSVVSFTGGETEEAGIAGFTIRNGSSLRGGGIYCLDSSPTVTNCTISENNVSGGLYGGGGIYCENSSPAIMSCRIIGNSAASAGGIFCFDSSPTITDCTITGNIANNPNGHGGGIYCNVLSQATITNCTITGNSANKGGGIGCSESSPVITNCTISGNDAEYGGGIHVVGNGSEIYPAIDGSTLSENSAYRGGAIYSKGDNFSRVYLTITNCSISKNSAVKGAGIWNHTYSYSTIANCTISENSAEDLGGGIYSAGGDTEITNSILWGDHAPEGPEMAISQGYNYIAVSYSDVQGGEAGVHIETKGTLVWLEGNIDSDPLFAGEGDYHLTAGSPCIDAGTDAGVYTDIDGDERPQGAGFDMGADENVDCRDYDGDHWPDEECGGEDCDDTTPLTHPGAPEICDGLDNNCDGAVPGDEVDGDGDGWMICSGDCNDADPVVNPEGREGPEGDPTCYDGIDNDCSGLYDMDDPQCFCRDIDGDGYFDELCGGDDCDDGDPAINPGEREKCTNGIDDDCDGRIDSEQASCVHVPGECPTIQAGIHAAADGDTVIVAPGTYVENIDFLGKAIAVRSEAGAARTAIDGNQANVVVLFDGGETNESILEGFTIRNGYSDFYYMNIGGGICCNDSSPVIRQCTITENRASYGGGISCTGYQCSPTIESCTITGNTAIHDSGGGIYSYIYFSSLTIMNCTITGNSTGEGPASEMTSGGGMSLFIDSSSLTIANSTISENNSGFGSGIWIRGGASSVVVDNCTISGNTAINNGGGIYINSPSTISSTISNCMIFENNAMCSLGYGYGGGILCSGSSTITNCTISGNISDHRGGGITCLAGSAAVSNCIFWGNSAPIGPEISVLIESTLTVRYSDVQGGEFDVQVEPGSAMSWLEGNIDVAPLFIGPVDYHLAAGSPCIDAGTDAGVYTDMDGDARPQGAGFDIGADEFTEEYCRDLDGDGHYDAACGGTDCDDSDHGVHPGAEELCDRADNDCNGIVDDRDWDGDLYFDQACWGRDCDDSDPLVHPGAAEICDGKDSDCDRILPEDEADEDEDGWGICQGDCDDTESAANPDMDEICGDRIDNDCNGLVDEEDWDSCPLLEMDASYSYGMFHLAFRLATPQTSTWVTHMILTTPVISIVPLWSVSIPAVVPPIDILISFPFPSLEWVGGHSGLSTQEGEKVFDRDWVYTG